VTWILIPITVDSRYYDTVGIRKMYQYIHSIDITSVNLYYLVMLGTQLWYRNKQHFDITDIVISREHCTNFRMWFVYIFNRLEYYVLKVCSK
jgi:hypothetical protein